MTEPKSPERQWQACRPIYQAAREDFSSRHSRPLQFVDLTRLLGGKPSVAWRQRQRKDSGEKSAEAAGPLVLTILILEFDKQSMDENRKMASGAPPGSRPLVAVALAQSLKAQLRVGSPDLPGPGRSLTRLRRRKSYAGTRNLLLMTNKLLNCSFLQRYLHSGVWSLPPSWAMAGSSNHCTCTAATNWRRILTLGVNDDQRGKGRAAFVAKVRTQVRSTL